MGKMLSINSKRLIILNGEKKKKGVSYITLYYPYYLRWYCTTHTCHVNYFSHAQLTCEINAKHVHMHFERQA